MPYRICKMIEIENGHMLSRHPDKCRYPHGHSRRVEIVLESDGLDDNGMVCDFKIIKEIMGDFLDAYDHALCVNSLDPMHAQLKEVYGDRVITFQGVEPTTEVLAQTFFEELVRQLQTYAQRPDPRYRLAEGVRPVKIRVWETSSSWAEYTGSESERRQIA